MSDVIQLPISFEGIVRGSPIEDFIEEFSQLQSIYNAATLTFASVDDVPNYLEEICNAMHEKIHANEPLEDSLKFNDLSFHSPLSSKAYGLAVGLLVIVALSDVTVEIKSLKASLKNKSIQLEGISIKKGALLQSFNDLQHPSPDINMGI